jgi:hypothetical protein
MSPGGKGYAADVLLRPATTQREPGPISSAAAADCVRAMPVPRGTIVRHGPFRMTITSFCCANRTEVPGEVLGEQFAPHWILFNESRVTKPSPTKALITQNRSVLLKLCWSMCRTCCCPSLPPAAQIARLL